MGIFMRKEKPVNATSANAGFFIGGRLLKNGGELPRRPVDQGIREQWRYARQYEGNVY
jgi:hypothetical protein